MKTQTYKCDRCGTVHAGKPALELTTYPVDHRQPSRTYDLCPPCLDRLVEWINTPPPSDRSPR